MNCCRSSMYWRECTTIHDWCPIQQAMAPFILGGTVVISNKAMTIWLHLQACVYSNGEPAFSLSYRDSLTPQRRDDIEAAVATYSPDCQHWLPLSGLPCCRIP